MGKQEEENIGVIKRFYQYLADNDREGAYENIIAEFCVLHETEVLP